MSFKFNPFTGNFDEVGSSGGTYTPPTSRIWMQNFTDFAIARPKIAYFGTTIENSGGSDITLTSNANDGTTFTINTAGIYAVHAIIRYTTTPGDSVGIARNTDGLTGMTSIPVIDMLAGQNVPSTNFVSYEVCRTMQLEVGDEIQFILDNSGGTTYTVGFFWDQFSIQKIT